MDIGPGDFVEAVKGGDVLGNRVTAGSVYVVDRYFPASIGECRDCATTSGPAIRLVGGTVGYAWCLCGFRPIYRPKPSLIEDLSQPVEHEPA